jgi:hypothetical protein
MPPEAVQVVDSLHIPGDIRSVGRATVHRQQQRADVQYKKIHLQSER